MNKYRNKKVEVDGIKFDSQREYKRYCQLILLQKLGEISELKIQVPFELIPKQKKLNGKFEHPVRYIADFSYIKNCVTVIEDSKGVRTADYIIKRKLMLKVYGIEIVEV